MITNLQNLKPGTAFRVHEIPDLTGTLVDINECSAKVSLGRHAVEVRIGDREFTAHRSRTEVWSPATVVETIEAQPATSPAAETDTCETCGAETGRHHIGPICPACSAGDNEENDDMAMKAINAKKVRKAKSTSTTHGGGGTRVRSSAKATKPADDSNPPTAKKADHPKPKAKTGMSLLDAAAEVMGSDGKAWSCAEIVEAVLAKGIWKTSGKTPAQTLYSALIRDIDGKGKDSLFCRGDQKGEFKLAAK